MRVKKFMVEILVPAEISDDSAENMVKRAIQCMAGEFEVDDPRHSVRLNRVTRMLGSTRGDFE